MSPSREHVDDILRALQERAKELNCLYKVEELVGDRDASIDEVCGRVIEAIPAGWQYPDVCAARMQLENRTHEAPGFRETPWRQSAAIRVMGEPVGQIDVVYLEQRAPADEGPFLKEERKLLETIADRVGSCVTHRRLLDAARHLQEQGGAADQPRRGWAPVVELLKHTDQSLLARVARKMLNHLCLRGIKPADAVLARFQAMRSGEEPDVFGESNRPRGRFDPPAISDIADQVFELAARHLGEEELVQCVRAWIKQDHASFLVNTLENLHKSITEVGDAIQRYHHGGHRETDLGQPTVRALLVALVRRFLSDELDYVNVAKRFVSIADFHELIRRLIYPAHGHGRIGGKGAGLFLAHRIVQKHRDSDELLASVRVPKTWYLTSDGIHDFIYCNQLEDVFTQKYKDIDEVRQEYPDLVQVFKNSRFSSEIVKGLSLALDDLGDTPLIVRSSSLLEDRFGAVFSGKYKSLFLANRGSKQERLEALMDAVAEVYASTFAPDPIQYRAERNLLDFQEGMCVLIQEVVGTRVRDYFLPACAGVALSQNEFRWSPRIRRDDGLIRLVPGLGTRAVDRVGDDYPVLVSPGQPNLRASATPEEIVRYAPRYIDVIRLSTNRFETVPAADFLRAEGANLPWLEQMTSIYDHGILRRPFPGQVDFDKDDLVITFDGLLTGTPFVRQLRALTRALETELGHPVDIEFAHDGRELYLLQCRAQAPTPQSRPAPIPRDLPRERIVFSARRHVSNGTVPNLSHVVYVDPARYAALSTREQLVAVGRAVGRLNKVLPKRQFLLMGPGRWGSRGDIRLGVSVTYSDICNAAMLIEIAHRTGAGAVDVSFGTHFFQDLVESGIRYLPLFPDDADVIFNEALLRGWPNLLAELAPDYRELGDVVRVLDVAQSADGMTLTVLMNGELDEAVAVLGERAAEPDGGDTGARVPELGDGQDWRWRARMAERIAARLDAPRLGVKAAYLIGSVKNATAGPASDIDLLLHVNGDESQRRELLLWLDGWSRCLSEMNYLRTGCRTDGLLDAHLITDDDIASRTSFAVKIGAVTDAARPLALGGA